MYRQGRGQCPKNVRFCQVFPSPRPYTTGPQVGAYHVLPLFFYRASRQAAPKKRPKYALSMQITPGCPYSMTKNRSCPGHLSRPCPHSRNRKRPQGAKTCHFVPPVPARPYTHAPAVLSKRLTGRAISKVFKGSRPPSEIPPSAWVAGPHQVGAPQGADHGPLAGADRRPLQGRDRGTVGLPITHRCHSLTPPL